ncbi:MAG: hypothetical protein M3128_14685 [Verrucomicrobiota bacterium]|nr:hypothetical protein [Verrucomicrobiota bacterium]
MIASEISHKHSVGTAADLTPDQSSGRETNFWSYCFAIFAPQQQVGASLPASSAGAPLVTFTSQPHSDSGHL